MVDDQTLHRFPESSGFDQKMQPAELEYLFSSSARRPRSPRITSACRIEGVRPGRHFRW